MLALQGDGLPRGVAGAWLSDLKSPGGVCVFESGARCVVLLLRWAVAQVVSARALLFRPCPLVT